MRCFQCKHMCADLPSAARSTEPRGHERSNLDAVRGSDRVPSGNVARPTWRTTVTHEPSAPASRRSELLSKPLRDQGAATAAQPPRSLGLCCGPGAVLGRRPYRMTARAKRSRGRIEVWFKPAYEVCLQSWLEEGI